MNQPTEDRFKRLEEEQRQLREEFRQFKEQQTEPIKITRLEIDTGTMHKKLDVVEENTNITKIEMQGARADISIVKANQSDLKEYLKEQFKSVEQKQEAHQELLGQLITIGEDHTKRFDHIDTAMATKDDISKMETRFDKLEGIMAQILNRLPKAEGE